MTNTLTLADVLVSLAAVTLAALVSYLGFWR
jgi:hypothetical protein